MTSDKITPTRKKCSKCGIIKTMDHFTKRSDSKDGYNQSCRECAKKRYLIKHPYPRYIDDSPDGFKRCSKCREVKKISEFYKNKAQKDGLSNQCKACNKKDWRDNRNENIKKSKERYYRNHEENKAKQRILYRDNVTEKRKAAKEYRDSLPVEKKEEFRLKQKQYYEKNKEALLSQKHEYHKKNQKKICEKAKERRRKNHEKIIISKRNYERKKLATDELYRLKKNLRRRVLLAIKNGKGEKKCFTQELLGCTFKEAKLHIESQFKPGMSWENYGQYGWHIDHIRPCASFDLTDPEQQKECFHYTNLQPLWAEENLKKGSNLVKTI